MPREACAEVCEDAARNPEQPDIVWVSDKRTKGAHNRDSQADRERGEADHARLGCNLEEVVVGVFGAVGKRELR